MLLEVVLKIFLLNHNVYKYVLQFYIESEIMKKEIILLALLATVSVSGISGCVQPSQWPFLQVTPTVLGGTGMVITDFIADPTEVYSNATGRVMMTVKNLGGALVDMDTSLVMIAGSGIKETLADGLYWTGSGTTTSVYQHFTKDMKPEDTVRGTPADEKTFTWNLRSPADIETGTTRTDVFIGRIYYDYTTTVTGNIWVYSQTESDAARAAGRELNRATFSSTSGPVALTLRSTPDPVVLATGENTFTMIMTISNVGGGALYETGSVTYTSGSEDVTLTTDELNRVDVTITSPGLTITGCSGSQELVGGKDLTLSCDVTVSTPPTAFASYQVKFVADYGYNTERTATVTVSGR